MVRGGIKVKHQQKVKKNVKQQSKESTETKKVNKKAMMEAKSPKTDKSSTHKLKDMDPEFYEFLEKEDKELLDDMSDDGDEDEMYEESDEDGDDDDEADEDGDGGDTKGDGEGDEDAEIKKIMEELEDSDESDVEGDVHEPPKELLEADPIDDSDQSDDEKADVDKEEVPASTVVKEIQSGRITVAMINRWMKILPTKPSPTLIHSIVVSLKLAVARVCNVSDVRSLENRQVLNGLIRLCLQHMLPALRQLLNLTKVTKFDRPSLITQSKSWTRVQIDVKGYLGSLLTILSEMIQPDTIAVILKHTLAMIVFFLCFSKLTRKLLKKLIVYWSEGEESIRVVAFLCIHRLVATKPDLLLDAAIRQMYITYVRNCKFTSPTTLPVINFMQRCLLEIFSIRPSLTYQYAFIYIRQLAIHLRNAIIDHKEEKIAAVYNWQYVHSIQLWVRVLSTLCPGSCLDPLIFPLTQTIIGTIKLLPTEKFYPLRFHCIRSLNQLSQATHVYIPILPFLIEVFELTDFNRHHQKTISLHPINFNTILKLAKSQVHEKAFKDGVIDQLYELLLEFCNIYSHEIGFPELILPALLQLKTFLKKCKVANYCRQLKQILELIKETNTLIVERRKNVTFKVSDITAIDMWQKILLSEGTPISKYHKTWRSMRDKELQHDISGKDRMMERFDDVPTIDRSKFKRKATDEEKTEFSALFDADSDSDDETRFMLKEDRLTYTDGAKKGRIDPEDSDQYSDFNDKELDQLAGSANESESEDEAANENDPGDEETVEDVAEEKAEETEEVEEVDEDMGDENEDQIEDLEISSDEADED